MSPSSAGRSRAPRPSMKLRGPLVLEQAMEMLQAAQTRDEVLGVFFTFARQFFDYSVLFVVGDDQAEGREAYGSGASTADVQRIAVPLAHGLLADVRKDGVLRIGALDKSGDDRELAGKLGRATTTPVAIVPLFIRSRVVLLLYGDRGGEAFGLHDIPELLGVLPRVGEAFERLIMERKGKYTPADRSGRAELKTKAAPVAKGTKAEEGKFGRGEGSGEGAVAKRLSKPPEPALAPEPRPPSIPPEPPPLSMPPTSPTPEPAKRDTLVDMVPPVEGIAATVAQAATTGVVPARTRRGEGGPLAVLGVPRSAPPPPMPRRSISQTMKAIAAPLPAPIVSETAKTTSFVKPDVPPEPTPSTPAPAKPETAKPPAMRSPTDSAVTQIAVPAAKLVAATSPDADTKAGPLAGLASKRTSGVTPAVHAPAKRPEPQPPADASDEPQTIVETTTIDDEEDEPEMTVSSSPALDEGDDLSDLEPEPQARPTRPMRGVGNYAMHIGSEERVGPTEVTAVKREKDTSPDKLSARTTTRSLRPHTEEPKVIVDMGESVEAVVVDLLRSPPEDPSTIDRILRLGEPALPVLVQGFPGHLWFDRHSPHTRLPRGRDVSAAARALVAFGDKAVPYVVTLLSSRDADTRFYATLVAAELSNAGLVPSLGARVFDDDANTRALVLDVLKLFVRYAGMRDVLDRIRLVARSPDKDVATRRMAVRALGELRDPRAVSLLVKLLEGTDPAIARESLRSLVLLTRTDLGDSPRKWEAWMAKNESRHRIEWLIDALLSDEDPLRAAAGDELQRLTHEYYGFHAGSPRKDRERVHKKYRDWWDREGKAKFSS